MGRIEIRRFNYGGLYAPLEGRRLYNLDFHYSWSSHWYFWIDRRHCDCSIQEGELCAMRLLGHFAVHVNYALLRCSSTWSDTHRLHQDHWLRHSHNWFHRRSYKNKLELGGGFKDFQVFTPTSDGNPRVPPQCHPPQEIRPYYWTINHWFPLIRAY